MFKILWNIKKRFKNIKAFTITEVLFVAIITTAVLATVLSVWVFTSKIWTEKNKQTVLRMGLMSALEVIKQDIRLSSFTDMVFYPKDASEYTAMSLPVADIDTNGLLTFNSDGRIDWDRTIIYHIHTDAEGDKTLRRTVYDPRNNSLSEDARDTQLLDVVTNGVGGAGSTTDTDFLEDLDIFALASLSPVFDFYDDSSTVQRVGKVTFGWAKLASGLHEIRFEIAGKNDDSSGYDIGIDNIRIEPSGSEREMEYYNSSFAPAGALTVSGGSVALVHDDIWSNDNFLEYSSVAVGDYIEIEDDYDLWRESSFATVSLNNTELVQNEVRVSLALPAESDEGEYARFAYISAGDTLQEGRDGKFSVLEGENTMEGVVIRTVLEDKDINMPGEEIDSDRSLVRVRLKASTGDSVIVSSAFITKRQGASGYDGTTNVVPGGGDEPPDYHFHQQLFFRDTSTGAVVPGVTIAADSEEWSLWTAFPIDTADDYFLTFCVENDNSLRCKYWEGSGGLTCSHYIVEEGSNICTADSASDTFFAALHGKSNGVPVTIAGDTLPAGIVETGNLFQLSGTPDWSSRLNYYIANRTHGTFQLSTTPGGPQDVNFTTNGSNLTYAEVSDVESTHRVYLTANIDTWDIVGSVESQVLDTMKAGPVYNQLKYSEDQPTGTGTSFKARSSSTADMSGAADWGTISGTASNPASLSLGSNRWVQFLGEFSTQPYWEEEVSSASLTYPQYVGAQVFLGGTYVFPVNAGRYYITKAAAPWVDDVEIDWPGTEGICALTGYVAKKDSYGQATITIDGGALMKVLSLHLKVSKLVDDVPVIEEGYIEIEPRNTGK